MIIMAHILYVNTYKRKHTHTHTLHEEVLYEEDGLGACSLSYPHKQNPISIFVATQLIQVDRSRVRSESCHTAVFFVSDSNPVCKRNIRMLHIYRTDG